MTERFTRRPAAGVILLALLAFVVTASAAEPGRRPADDIESAALRSVKGRIRPLGVGLAPDAFEPDDEPEAFSGALPALPVQQERTLHPENDLDLIRLKLPPLPSGEPHQLVLRTLPEVGDFVLRADTVMSLHREVDGKLGPSIAEDDDSGPGFTSRISLPVGGSPAKDEAAIFPGETLLIAIRAFDPEIQTFRYRFKAEFREGDRYEPNEFSLPGEVAVIPSPVRLTGRTVADPSGLSLSPAGDRDAFEFLLQGSSRTLSISTFPAGGGDTLMTLQKGQIGVLGTFAFKNVALNDDRSPGRDRGSRISRRLQPGRYRILVTGRGPAFPYDLELK